MRKNSFMNPSGKGNRMAPGNGLSCIPLKEREGEKFEKVYKVNVYAGG